MKVRFVVKGEPKGKGRPRFTKQGHTYTPKDTKDYEKLVAGEYSCQVREKFPEDAMLDLRILAYFSIPKSKSKKVKFDMAQGKIRPTKKCDADNIIKIVADALNDVAYHDDKQIVDVQCRKFYSEEPRIEVIIREVT